MVIVWSIASGYFIQLNTLLHKLLFHELSSTCNEIRDKMKAQIERQPCCSLLEWNKSIFQKGAQLPQTHLKATWVSEQHYQRCTCFQKTYMILFEKQEWDQIHCYYSMFLSSMFTTLIVIPSVFSEEVTSVKVFFSNNCSRNTHYIGHWCMYCHKDGWFTPTDTCPYCWDSQKEMYVLL